MLVSVPGSLLLSLGQPVLQLTQRCLPLRVSCGVLSSVLLYLRLQSDQWQVRLDSYTLASETGPSHLGCWALPHLLLCRTFRLQGLLSRCSYERWRAEGSLGTSHFHGKDGRHQADEEEQ